ncbi:DEAD/DEAH box helicase [Pleionea mediterranea]|uniref:ATP-dependent RNA helicase RhlE n=1 Tax=Pleionea mediterranea TaxID=523701 RepID=A0A316G3M9_9GAMM|nr:DEAD/DEAH box helicase [Pleionea mediterranea]PWK54390.1 ATP-dependent RNA helicase RhlE [Pleionea mediterranea]
MPSFAKLNLIDALTTVLDAERYRTPTDVQSKVIPLVLQGKDVMAAAETGSGKTAAYVLPLLQRLAEQTVSANEALSLILVPTRELAIQVHGNILKYGANLNLRSEAVFGGVKINPQMKRLRAGVSLLVATPGRLLDLMSKNAVRFDRLQALVLDEADRMLDLGFLPDIQQLLLTMPEKKQTLLFSATYSPAIKTLAHNLSQSMLAVQVNAPNQAARKVIQWLHPVDKQAKTDLLLALINDNQWRKVLVFVKTKKGANKLAFDLKKGGVSSGVIHGDKSQKERIAALESFKLDKINVLVATDVAARGLDIEQLPQVVNYDLPKIAEDYVHRIGRTGRAGETGHAVSLVSADEVDQLRKIESLIKQLLPRKLIAGFEPNHNLPETRLVAAKKKKPHKKKLAKAQQKKAKPSKSKSKNRNEQAPSSRTGRRAPKLS